MNNGEAILLERVRELWIDIAEIILSRFNLETPSIPSKVTIDETMETWSKLSQETLFLSDVVVRGETPLDAVISSTCLRESLPKSRICMEWIEDIANEFARQYISPDSRERWTEIWRQQTPTTIIDEVLNHSPQNAYITLYELVGERALNGIVSDLVNASRYDMEMSLEDYIRYFNTTASRFTVKLDSTELVIIDNLLKKPETTPKSLSTKVALTPQWISTKISELQRKLVLRKFETVRFSKIGIRMFQLLVGHNSDDASKEYLSGCPFLYGIRPVISRPRYCLAILAVPDNQNSIDALEKVTKHLVEREIDHRLFEVISSGTNYCFDYYEVDKGTWAIPWNLEAVQLAKIHRDGLASLFPRITEEKTVIQKDFDEFDIQILGCMWRGVSSVSKIRTELRAGQERVANKLKTLREKGVISLMWEIHNIGLSENLIVFTDDIQTGESLAAWSQRFPRIIQSFDENQRLVLVTSLPQGGCYEMVMAMQTLEEPIQIDILGQPLHGNWVFPVDLWDANRQYWRSPDDKIDQWMDSII